MKHLFIVTLLLMAGFSCKNTAAEPRDTGLVGKWENIAFENVSEELPDGGLRLKRAQKLPDRNYGFEFRANGSLVSRESAGFCGTPLTYGTFTGRWSVNNDILTLDKKYWGGDQVRSYKIVRLGEDELILSYL